ncbi:MAG: hypothetical protein ACYDG6_11995 [Thermincolia bacterium]
MDRREIISLLRRVNETVEDNKDFLDELDNRSQKNFGTMLAWNIQKILHSGNSSDNIINIIDTWGEILATSQGPVTRYYGSTLRKILKDQQEISELSSSFLIGFINKLFNEVNHEKKLSRVNSHLPMWGRLISILEEGVERNLTTREIIKSALADFQWRLPKAANRSITLARLLIIRTIVLELDQRSGHSHFQPRIE